MYSEEKIDSNTKKELLFRVDPWRQTATILLVSIVFGSSAVMLVSNGKQGIGVLVGLATVAMDIALLLELCNARLLVTTEEIYQRDFSKRETYILWEECDAIFMDVRKRVSYVDVTKARKDWDKDSDRQSDKEMIMIPWSNFSKKQKEMFFSILADSKIPEHVRRDFIREHDRIRAKRINEMPYQNPKKKFIVSMIVSIFCTVIFVYGANLVQEKGFLVLAALVVAEAVRNVVKYVKGIGDDY